MSVQRKIPITNNIREFIGGIELNSDKICHEDKKYLCELKGNITVKDIEKICILYIKFGSLYKIDENGNYDERYIEPDEILRTFLMINDNKELTFYDLPHYANNLATKIIVNNDAAENGTCFTMAGIIAMFSDKKVYYKYSGKITYTFSTPIEDVKNMEEIIDTYNIDEINEISCYELNHQLFEPTFSGEYEIIEHGTEYIFTYHCYSKNNDRIKSFNEFMEIEHWSLDNKNVHDDLQDRINHHFFIQSMANNETKYDSDDYDGKRKMYNVPIIDFSCSNATVNCIVETIEGSIDDMYE